MLDKYYYVRIMAIMAVKPPGCTLGWDISVAKHSMSPWFYDSPTVNTELLAILVASGAAAHEDWSF